MKLNSVKLIQKNNCCGCTACYSVCPKGAIKMVNDSEGFLYPRIDEKKCINCGLCLRVCNNKTNYLYDKNVLSVFAAKNKNIDILKKSSSGGVSHALCKKIIDLGGIVYGVVYDNNHKVIIERETTKKSIEKLYGSKYVQADPQGSFKQVYNDLCNNKTVLYIATSCYIAGLKSYLEIKKCNLKKLYTVDLICHGTPSPKLFEDYIIYLKKKYDFSYFEFRTKELPWGYGSKNYGCTIHLKNGKKIIDSADSRLFLQLFFSNYCLRPICYKCDYAKVEKPADITIADYWGINEVHPNFFDENGVSAVIIHTKKGAKLFNMVDDLLKLESSIDDIKKRQPNLDKPSLIQNDRDIFWKDYNKKGFKYVSKKYCGSSIIQRIKKKIKKFI